MGWLAALFSLPVLIHLLVLRPFMKLVFGIGVEGREHLTHLGQFILVANHNSHLDILLIFHLLPVRQLSLTHPVAAEEYFAKSRIVFGLVNYLFRPIWIVRGDRESDPLEGMRERLREGKSIVIFPEGTRGEAGELAHFKTGVGRLAVEFPEIPVVPVFLTGPEKAFPKSAAVPVPVWNRVVVGPPQLLRGSSEDIASALEEMVRELAESEMGGRHRRRARSREVPTVAVLGIDGSGKSTLSRILAQRLSLDARAALITDDVIFFEEGHRKETQPLLTEKLREAIGRRAKAAESLKSYKVPKLAELLLRDHIVELVRRWYAPDAIVMDGSPLLNVTAWAKLYLEEEFDDSICASAIRVLAGREDEVPKGDPVFETFPEVAALQRLHLASLELPDAVLFLDVDPSVSMERIRSRGEKQQVHETEEKLGRLRDGYRMVCRVVQEELGIPTRTVDGRGTVEEVATTAVIELRGMNAPLLQRLELFRRSEAHD
jgi:1-acyl-sn-glycerol-3-phosphate acyltransferase